MIAVIVMGMVTNCRCEVVPVERAGRSISGILPGFAGFWNDPAESVIEQADINSLEAAWEIAR